jgi:hypothetical protein
MEHTATLPPGDRSPRFPITQSQCRKDALGKLLCDDQLEMYIECGSGDDFDSFVKRELGFLDLEATGSE